jgi:hypothetical protein
MGPGFAVAGKIGVGPRSRNVLSGRDLPHGGAWRDCEIAGGLGTSLRQIVPSQAFDLCDSLPRKPHGSNSPAWLVIGGGRLGILAFQMPQDSRGILGAPRRYIGPRTVERGLP